MNNTITIAYIGDLTVDTYVDSGESRLGGAALNGAIWAVRLGAHASIVTAVGTDNPGKQFLAKIKSHGIDGKYVQKIQGNTSSIEIHVDVNGERTYGAWDPGTLAHYHLRATDIKKLQKTHAISVTVYPQYLHILDELKKIGTVKKPLVVVNFGDLHEFNSDLAVVQQYLPQSDICVFGLHAETDKKLILSIAQLAITHKKMMLITLGAQGSTLCDGTRVFVQPAKAVSVVDTTGAGDAFLSAFLVQYCQSKDIQSSLQHGSEFASHVITQFGAY